MKSVLIYTKLNRWQEPLDYNTLNCNIMWYWAPQALSYVL